ncbi:MAG: mevalonate kinase [Anaerolineales bacterium]|nr:mevalonate kinase [Anaerolineales bacterium]
MNHGQAPGKIILFGEHSVVYGQPALAVPVDEISAHAFTAPITAPAGSVCIQAPDIALTAWLHDLPEDHPLGLIVHLTLQELACNLPPFVIRISSTIPVAAGLGSGAAVSIAIVRSICAYAGKTIHRERQSQLAYEVERIYHGTPSGIDNTVIAFHQPVWFIRGEKPEPFSIKGKTGFVIADTGIQVVTAEAVGQVRELWEKDSDGVNIVFQQMGDIAQRARASLEQGDLASLGSLMNENQTLLAALGVSSPELEKLLHASREAGALGAKLSGAGLGGNIIALVGDDPAPLLTALVDAGAAAVLFTRIGP